MLKSLGRKFNYHVALVEADVLQDHILEYLPQLGVLVKVKDKPAAFDGFEHVDAGLAFGVLESLLDHKVYTHTAAVAEQDRRVVNMLNGHVQAHVCSLEKDSDVIADAHGVLTVIREHYCLVGLAIDHALDFGVRDAELHRLTVLRV